MGLISASQKEGAGTRKIPFKFIPADSDPAGLRVSIEEGVPVYAVPHGVSGWDIAARSCLKVSRAIYGFNGKYFEDKRPG